MNAITNSLTGLPQSNTITLLLTISALSIVGATTNVSVKPVLMGPALYGKLVDEKIAGQIGDDRDSRSGTWHPFRNLRFRLAGIIA